MADDAFLRIDVSILMAKKGIFEIIDQLFLSNICLDLACTANIFNVIFTVFKCVPISTVISLYGLHLIAAPSKVE